MKKVIIAMSSLALVVAAAALLVWAWTWFFHYPPSLDQSIRKTAMEDPVGIIFSQYLDPLPSWAVSACHVPDDYCGGYPSCAVQVFATAAVGRTGGAATEGSVFLLNGRSPITSSTFVVIGENAYAKCGGGSWQISHVTPSSTGPAAWASLIRSSEDRDQLVDLFVRSHVIRAAGIPKRTQYDGDDEWRIPVRIDAVALRSFLDAVGAGKNVSLSSDILKGDAYVNPTSFRLDALDLGPVEPHEGARVRMLFSTQEEHVVPPGAFVATEGLRPASLESTGRVLSATTTVSGLDLAAGSSTGTPQSDDTDRDGLTDALETFYGSDPRNPDTDGDGVTDGAEVAAGRDPAGPGLLYEFRGSATSTP